MAEGDQQAKQASEQGAPAGQAPFPGASAFIPPTLPETSVFSPPAGPADARANQEAALLAQGGDLEVDAKKQEHGRHQSFRNHINIALIIVFWIIALSLVIGIAIYSWHILVPDKWKFLTEKGFEKLQTLLGSAILSSALSGYVKQRMD